MVKRDPGLDVLYEAMAGRFGALSRLFADLGSPAAVQELFGALMSDDAAAFVPFADRFDIPMIGKCLWVRDVVERVLDGPSHLVDGDCWLRDDLTPAQTLLYFHIALRHGAVSRRKTQQVLVTLRNGHNVISPGPFLDELKANGLVNCDPPQVVSDKIISAVLAPPEQVCF